MTKHDSFVRMTTDDRYGLADDGNTLYGYLAVFDQDTRINNWEGDFIERISPGAFTKTIEERAERVKILYDHGFDPSVGNKPLGVPSVLREDDHGLYVEVPLDDTSYNRDLKASLKSGAIDGMSFRFSVVKEDWDEDANRRTLKEVVLHEGGPVTFPAYAGASAGIRTADDFRAWRQGHTTIDTTSSGNETTVTIEEDLPSEADRQATSVGDEPPVEALVNPARQRARQMSNYLRRFHLGTE